MEQTARQQISAILGMHIPQGGYSQVFESLDKLGKINNKQMIQILVVLCEKIDQYEQNGKK